MCKVIINVNLKIKIGVGCLLHINIKHAFIMKKDISFKGNKVLKLFFLKSLHCNKYALVLFKILFKKREAIEIKHHHYLKILNQNATLLN